MMLDPVQGISQGYPGVRVTGYPGKDKVKEEFLAIFYKELLKQVFKSPDLTLGEEKDGGSDVVSSFSSDLMVEKMAQLMAQKSYASLPDFLPVEEGK